MKTRRNDRFQIFTVGILFALAWSTPAFCGEIHDAVRHGDLAKVKALVQANPDVVSSKDGYNETPLHVAAQFGRIDVARFLLANKAEVNARDLFYRTPLHEAAEFDNTELAVAMVELLLANGAGVNAKANDGATPLSLVPTRDKEVADLLRRHGGRDPFAQNGQSAQLLISIFHGNSNKSRIFLAGEISVSGAISAIVTDSFTCIPVRSLKTGDKIAVMASDDQAWSVDTHSLQVGTKQVAYPSLAMVKSSNSASHGIFPAILKPKAGIKAGETLRSSGYQIEAKRAVKAGEAISVLVFLDGAILSVEAEGGRVESED